MATVGLTVALGCTVAAAPALADGAVVINDQGCSLLDGNGAFAAADSDHAVITPSGNGVLKCKATVAPPAGGKAVQWNLTNTGVFCSTLAGFTDDWRETVSASGEATLTCKVH